MRPMPSSPVLIGSGSAGADTDALFGEVVHEVEDFAQVPAEPVKGVDDDGVTGAGVAQQRGKPVAVDGGAGAFVSKDPLVGNASGSEGVELPFEALFDGGDPGVAEVESLRWVGIAGGHGHDRTESLRRSTSRCGTLLAEQVVERIPARWGLLRMISAERSGSLEVEQATPVPSARRRYLFVHWPNPEVSW